MIERYRAVFLTAQSAGNLEQSIRILRIMNRLNQRILTESRLRITQIAG